MQMLRDPEQIHGPFQYVNNEKHTRNKKMNPGQAWGQAIDLQGIYASKTLKQSLFRPTQNLSVHSDSCIQYPLIYKLELMMLPWKINLKDTMKCKASFCYYTWLTALIIDTYSVKNSVFIMLVNEKQICWNYHSLSVLWMSHLTESTFHH